MRCCQAGRFQPLLPHHLAFAMISHLCLFCALRRRPWSRATRRSTRPRGRAPRRRIARRPPSRSNADAFPGQRPRPQRRRRVEDAALARTATGANYLNAAARVGVVSTVVGLNIALPVEATRRVTRGEPTVEDGVWTWDPHDRRAGHTRRPRVDGPRRRLRDRLAPDVAAPGRRRRAVHLLHGHDRRHGQARLVAPVRSPTPTALSSKPTSTSATWTTARSRSACPTARDRAGSTVLYRTDDGEQTFDFFDDLEDERALHRVGPPDSGAGSIDGRLVQPRRPRLLGRRPRGRRVLGEV